MTADVEDEIPESIKRHLAEIRVWLDENVTVYENVKSITMHRFEIDWNKMNGTFFITVDGQECDMRFSFASLTATGKTEVYRPMFHSPLGAPASYAAIEISEKIIDRMAATLTKAMPSIKPLGLDKVTGKILTFGNPSSERLPPAHEIQAAKDIMSQPNFSITLDFS